MRSGPSPAGPFPEAAGQVTLPGLRPVSLAAELDDPEIGEEIHRLAATIFPLGRSLTGPGVRETLRVLGGRVPIAIHELPTGAPILDWTVPREWRIRDAYIKDPSGGRVVDWRASNLHVVGYSAPVRAVMTREALVPHIHTLPDQPDLIPYRTAYHAETWGFCMAHAALAQLPEGPFEVVIDADLIDGAMTWGEWFKPGRTDAEVLISTHICHPSLANDNCSGLALLATLAARLEGLDTHFGYRFLFTPGTIGGIAWLAVNDARVDRIRHGLVMSCVGDGGGPTYKRSRRGDAPIDRAMGHLVRRAGGVIEDFSPYGYDERQYNSPGYDLPVGLFQRSKYGTFPEYHTSADNLGFIRPDHLATSYRLIAAALDILENDWMPINTSPKGEPQLGRRGLYGAIGGESIASAQLAMLWVLNLADGRHSLLDMAERAGLGFCEVARTARVLSDAGLLR